MASLREKLYDEILNLKVYDTHSHLIGGALSAKDFWQIGEYFWFLRELQAAGYPKDADKLEKDERIAAYAKAFQATRNTTMNWVVRRIFHDLYEIEISDIDSIYRATESVEQSSRRAEWAAQVANKLSIDKIVINRPEHMDFSELPGAAVLVPRIDGKLNTWLEQIRDAEDQALMGEKVTNDIKELLARYKQSGCRGIMTTLPRLDLSTYKSGDRLHKSNNTYDQVLVYLLHRICESVTENGMFLQLFLGMENGWSSIVTSVNDPKRIVNLHGLFEEYPCKSQLVLASEINNMDVVQAARIFPNVYVGGLWWFNFRVSTYRECMQKRLEALPPVKSAIVASDARCIEWCYGKILLVKRLLADFLYEQIVDGWLDFDEALRVASEWLYGSAVDLAGGYS